MEAFQFPEGFEADTLWEAVGEWKEELVISSQLAVGEEEWERRRPLNWHTENAEVLTR